MVSEILRERAWPAIGICVVAMLHGCAADGTNAERAANAHTFKCSGPEGDYQRWNTKVAAQGGHIAGEIQPGELKKPPFMASAVVELRDNGRHETLSLQFATAPGVRNRFNVALTRAVDGNPAIRQYVGTVWSDRVIPFSVDYREGTISVVAEGLKAEQKTGPFNPDRLSLGCSSGEFVFDDVSMK